ncbi:MAG: ROK family protein [Atopococcus tabaci]|uniref:ROK family protein n=1 Tax=Atopococcus tabaci TaxID=269774 RepID=A0AA43ZSL5_9LACT|nr:ROK family protein [Atopococcus tabaci]
MKTITVDIGGTNIQYAVIKENDELDYFHEYPTPVGQGGVHMIEQLAEKLYLHMDQVTSIGISTANQVDSETGVIIYANDNIPDYTGTPIKEILEKRLAVPVVVENDVNAAAIGEREFGDYKGLEDFIMLTYGTGIGGAIFMVGKLYKGSNYGAGEFGHMTTHIDGLRCNCGQFGCYERYASTQALVRQAEKLNPLYDNGKIIMRTIKEEKDPSLTAIYHTWIHEIGQGLMTIIVSFQPSLILLGGGIMEESKIVEDIERDIKKTLMSSFSHVSIQSASLGNKAALYGALHLARSLVQSLN